MTILCHFKTSDPTECQSEYPAEKDEGGRETYKSTGRFITTSLIFIIHFVLSDKACFETADPLMQICLQNKSSVPFPPVTFTQGTSFSLQTCTTVL